MDIMLPGRDGVEVTRTLRIESSMPIIMLTAKDEEIDRVLGLENSKHLIEVNKEEIWAESEQSQGSTFYFSLPLADPA